VATENTGNSYATRETIGRRNNHQEDERQRNHVQKQLRYASTEFDDRDVQVTSMILPAIMLMRRSALSGVLMDGLRMGRMLVNDREAGEMWRRGMLMTMSLRIRNA